jgi:hypothetical protein
MLLNRFDKFLRWNIDPNINDLKTGGFQPGSQTKEGIILAKTSDKLK